MFPAALSSGIRDHVIGFITVTALLLGITFLHKVFFFFIVVTNYRTEAI